MSTWRLSWASKIVDGSCSQTANVHGSSVFDASLQPRFGDVSKHKSATMLYIVRQVHLPWRFRSKYFYLCEEARSGRVCSLKRDSSPQRDCDVRWSLGSSSSSPSLILIHSAVSTPILIGSQMLESRLTSSSIFATFSNGMSSSLSLILCAPVDAAFAMGFLRFSAVFFLVVVDFGGFCSKLSSQLKHVMN